MLMRLLRQYAKANDLPNAENPVDSRLFGVLRVPYVDIAWRVNEPARQGNVLIPRSLQVAQRLNLHDEPSQYEVTLISPVAYPNDEYTGSICVGLPHEMTAHIDAEWLARVHAVFSIEPGLHPKPSVADLLTSSW